MKLLFFFFSLIALPFFGIGQSRIKLEKERNAIIKKIEQTNKILELTEKKSENTLHNLTLLNVEIKDRESLIENNAKELKFIKTNELKLNISKDSLKTLLDVTQKNYNELLNIEYRKKLFDSKWLYIFSSININEAFLKYRYIEQYKSYIKHQYLQLQQQTQQYNINLVALQNEQYAKNELLNLQKESYSILQNNKTQKNKVLNSINKDITKINQQLDDTKKRRETLNQKIENVILSNLINSKSEIIDFDNQKKYLPWPLDNPLVVSSFGIKKFNDLNSVEINNNGIDISSDIPKVKAVYNGLVIANLEISNQNKMLIIQHGSYYTVYSNLVHISVNRGDKVTTSQIIGSIKLSSTLHFELWENKTKLDPELWLK